MKIILSNSNLLLSFTETGRLRLMNLLRVNGPFVEICVSYVNDEVTQKNFVSKI